MSIGLIALIDDVVSLAKLAAASLDAAAVLAFLVSRLTPGNAH